MSTITVVGNLTADPELRFTPQGKAVLKAPIAENFGYRDATGAWVEGATSFHNVIVWGAQGENCAESLVTGDRVVVVGRLEQRSYDNEAGEKRTVWEITADEVSVGLRYATAKPVKSVRTATQD